MKKLILIAAIVAMTVTSSAPALSAAAPTAEQCKNATDPGNISPQVSTESNGQTLEVKVSGAYGLNPKQRKMYRYKTTGQQRTKWLEAKSYTWQLPESAAGTDINVRVWVCAYKKNTWVKGQLHPYTRIAVPATRTGDRNSAAPIANSDPATNGHANPDSNPEPRDQRPRQPQPHDRRTHLRPFLSPKEASNPTCSITWAGPEG